MRIALSSSTFRRPLASGRLTQLEWLERSASELGVDGLLAASADFPRTDADYVAQTRKVCVDLSVVPFGIDAEPLFGPDGGAACAAALALAAGFGALIVRTTLPPPGDVPPAAFVEASRAGKAVARTAKAANVTVLVATAPGTLGADADGVKHFAKDVDSAWIRACPSALLVPSAKDRIPAFCARPGDDPRVVASRARGAWVILDIPATEEPWREAAAAIGALRDADRTAQPVGR